MSEMLNLQFMQNAFLGGFLISILCGMIGALVVINKMSYIAGGIAHGAYGGVGMAVFFGISPIFGAAGFALILAIFTAFITNKHKERFDALIGAIWAFGTATGIILIDLSGSYGVDINGYLFGSILSVSRENLIFAGCCDVVFIVLILLFYRQFLALSFDKEFAGLRGVKTEIFYYILIIMIALSVVAAIQTLGLILVIALMSIPPFIAEKLSKNLAVMMILGSIISALFCTVGLIFSYKFNLTSGASIIMVAVLSYFLFFIFKKSKA